MQLMKEQKQLATTMSTDEEVMNKKFDASQIFQSTIQQNRNGNERRKQQEKRSKQREKRPELK